MMIDRHGNKTQIEINQKIFIVSHQTDRIRLNANEILHHLNVIQSTCAGSKTWIQSVYIKTDISWPITHHLTNVFHHRT